MLFRFSDIGRVTDISLGLRWTPTDFESEILRRAAVLSANGIRPGSKIVVGHSGSAHFLADLFSAWTMGCTAICVDPALTPSELGTLISFVEPVALLVGDTPINLSCDVRVINLSRTTSCRSSVSLPTADPKETALILFTSGTTGDPKGVVLSLDAVLTRIALNRIEMRNINRQKTLVALPMSFGHGLIGNTLTPLLSGSEIVLHPLGLSLARNLGQIIDEYQIGFLSSVPAFWRIALKLSRPPARSTLTRIHVGSAPLPASLWTDIAEWSRADVANCYGITELANWVAGASSATDGIADGLVGRPWGGKAAVKDNAGTIREIGEGEILIRSPSVMSGYLRRPDLTASVLHDGWFHTGDTGQINQRGIIRLTGRLKDEINRAGFKIQPAEIEALLTSHPDVSDACVFGIADDVSGEVVAAVVCARPGQNISIQILQQWCAERLRRDAIPERWFFVDKVPRNDRGKVNRNALRRMATGETQ